MQDPTSKASGLADSPHSLIGSVKQPETLTSMSCRQRGSGRLPWVLGGPVFPCRNPFFLEYSLGPSHVPGSRDTQQTKRTVPWWPWHDAELLPLPQCPRL